VISLGSRKLTLQIARRPSLEGGKIHLGDAHSPS